MNFLKSALVNGLAILLPVVLVFIAIKEIPTRPLLQAMTSRSGDFSEISLNKIARVESEESMISNLRFPGILLSGQVGSI